MSVCLWRVSFWVFLGASQNTGYTVYPFFVAVEKEKWWWTIRVWRTAPYFQTNPCDINPVINQNEPPWFFEVNLHTPIFSGWTPIYGRETHIKSNVSSLEKHVRQIQAATNCHWWTAVQHIHTHIQLPTVHLHRSGVHLQNLALRHSFHPCTCRWCCCVLALLASTWSLYSTVKTLWWSSRVDTIVALMVFLPSTSVFMVPCILVLCEVTMVGVFQDQTPLKAESNMNFSSAWWFDPKIDLWIGITSD